MQVTVGLGQFDIDARANGENRRFLFVARDTMAVSIRTIAQFPDGVVIRNTETFKTPFFPKDVAQKPFVGVGRNTVDLIVRWHHAESTAFFKGLFEWIEKGFAQDTHRNVDRSTINSRFRLAVSGEVFKRGYHMLFVAESPIALKSLHGGNTHARHKERIFTVSFFDATPSRIASDIDDWGQGLMGPARTRFFGSHCEKRANKVRVECGSQPNRLRKARSANGRLAVKAFLVKNDGNAKAGVFDEELLNGVR